jgi:malonyl CoA-acyl carrier protein transacylase
MMTATIQAMAKKPRKLEKRTFAAEEDLLEALDAWQAQTRVQKNLAVQAGLWHVMGLSLQEFTQLCDDMDGRVDAVEELAQRRRERHAVLTNAPPNLRELRAILEEVRNRLDRVEEEEETSGADAPGRQP